MAEGAARRRESFGSYEEALANFASKPPLNQLHRLALESYVRGGFAMGSDGSVTLRCAPTTEAAVFRGAADSGAWDALPQLDLPVAIVAGRQEESGPGAFGPAALTQLRHGTFIERRHLGHFGPLEDPEGAARDIAAWVDATTNARGERHERRGLVTSEALLIMDLQNGVVERFPSPQMQGLLDTIARTAADARHGGVPVIYVRVAFRPGGSDVSPRNQIFARLARQGGMGEADPGRRSIRQWYRKPTTPWSRSGG